MSSSGIKSRLSHAQWTLKPQDLAVAFKLVCLKGQRLPYAALAHALHLSPFEAHACIARLSASRLLTEVDGVPSLVMPAFRPLVLQGAVYFFPPVRGEVTVGFPTAHGAEPLKSKVLFADELPPVWPHPDGTTRGSTLLPPLIHGANGAGFAVAAILGSFNASQSPLPINNVDCGNCAVCPTWSP